MNRRGFLSRLCGLLGLSVIPDTPAEVPLRDDGLGEMSLAWGGGGTVMWYYLGENPPSSLGLTHYHGMMTLPDGTTHRLFSYDKRDSDV